MRVITCICIVLFMYSCVNKKSITIPEFEEVKFLMHKGCGVEGKYGNKFKSNSLEGIFTYLELTDGVEIDVQLSSDSALILFHDIILDDSSNIFSFSKSQLNKMESKLGYKIATLEEFFEEIVSRHMEEKIISLDLKMYYNPEVIKNFGSSLNLTQFLIEELIKLDHLTADLNLKLEAVDRESYDLFKSSGFIVFLLNPSKNFKERKSLNINEVNNFSANNQYWVLNDVGFLLRHNTIDSCLVQSDNSYLLDFIIKNRGRTLSTNQFFKTQFAKNFTGEFIEVAVQKEGDFLFEIHSDIKSTDDVFFVVSESGNCTNCYYNKLKIEHSNDYFYLNKAYAEDTSNTWNVYLWNIGRNDIGGRTVQINTYRVD